MKWRSKVITERLSIDPERPDEEIITRAAHLIRRGRLVAFPTETVYGLGASALDADAVARIFDAKGRPATNPLIVHAPDIAAARRIVTEWPEAAQNLAERFWPGPLTLVLPKSRVIPDLVTAGGSTVAVRVPAHHIALRLLQVSGLPIAAPSANRSTRISPTTADHVIRGLSGIVDLVLDGGPTSGGIESTVLDLTANPPMLLRPGLISSADIEREIGTIVACPASQERGPSRSPGMSKRHYAPNAILEIAHENGRERTSELLALGRKVGWITFETDSGLLDGVYSVTMPKDPALYAQRIYAVLHELDDAGIDRIVVDAPPEDDSWFAVRDRLRRAASVDATDIPENR